MSRALDKGIRAILADGRKEEAFQSIAALLCEASGPLLEIELLGLSHTFDTTSMFLRDGNAIAIPKARLVQAFIHARSALQANIECRETLTGAALPKATAVILLFDPEHLAAANARKRFLSSTTLDSNDATALFQQESFFIDSLLTSRLHRHTKSPTLWSHRRWLMEKMRETGAAINAARDIRTVVFVSAERHPRNYYAWCHARHLVAMLQVHGGKGVEAELITVLADTKKWCFSHHDDVSGWMFLASMLARLPFEAEDVLAETLNLVESFRWRNESVWYFLRNTMLDSRVSEALHERFASVRQSLYTDAQCSSHDREILDRAASWMRTFSAESMD
ncbi:hypothetical protein HIM_01556 [Hirsutella minnesotensis 3608]|nr:hypothetical protein HIM_01556 [Hirsutella minnesotensis 3608]